MSRTHRESAQGAPHRPAGFSLVSALFLLVVLGSLGTAMVSLSGVQHHTSMLGLQSTRALAAAHAGLEWGSYQALRNGICAPNQSLSLTEDGLRGFTVTVSCAASNHRERAASFSVYIIEAQAVHGAPGDPGYVFRHVKGKVSDAPGN